MQQQANPYPRCTGQKRAFHVPATNTRQAAKAAKFHTGSAVPRTTATANAATTVAEQVDQVLALELELQLAVPPVTHTPPRFQDYAPLICPHSPELREGCTLDAFKMLALEEDLRASAEDDAAASDASGVAPATPLHALPRHIAGGEDDELRFHEPGLDFARDPRAHVRHLDPAPAQTRAGISLRFEFESPTAGAPTARPPAPTRRRAPRGRGGGGAGTKAEAAKRKRRGKRAALVPQAHRDLGNSMRGGRPANLVRIEFPKSQQRLLSGSTASVITSVMVPCDAAGSIAKDFLHGLLAAHFPAAVGPDARFRVMALSFPKQQLTAEGSTGRYYKSRNDIAR